MADSTRRYKIETALRDELRSGFPSIERRFSSEADMTASIAVQRRLIDGLDRKSDYRRRLAGTLDVIADRSRAHLGISYMTENTIRRAYEEKHGSPVSKRSVGTYVGHLKRLGIVTSVNTRKHDGRQSANILVLERADRGNHHAKDLCENSTA